MNILLESSVLTWQIKGGVSRYIVELYEGLQKYSNVQICTWFSKNIFLKNKFAIPVRNAISLNCNNYLTKKRIAKGNYELLHVPSIADYFMDVLPPEKPLVITIHDLIAEKFPNEFKEDVRLKNQKLINRANRIIAISENTKNDLISYYGISEDKIDVIYHGSPFSAEAVANSKIENSYGDYLLYVGYRGGYKNFNLFCWALSSVIKDKPQIKVILIGGRNLNKEERELIHSLHLENNIIHYKTVTENQLISLYKNAKAFVFPSKYEGFGFPILEAFSCKTPVICSDRSSLPEIAGNAAHYFNPDDYESIANSILQVINSDEITKTLIQNGTERIKVFNWTTTIEQTLNCYMKTLNVSSKSNDR